MIRRATANDAEALTRISFAAKGMWNYPAEYMAIWADELTVRSSYLQHNEAFVFELDRTPVAYYSLLVLDEPFDAGPVTLARGIWLDHMFVQPEHIGNSFGTRLFAHCLNRCRLKKQPTLHILADPHSTGFYLKMGCRYIEEYPSTIPGRTTPYLQYMLNTQ